MNIPWKTFFLIGGLAGCDTYGDYRDKPADIEVHLSKNYQAVYAQLVSTMRACLAPGRQMWFTTSTVNLDSDLYPDLGYGEVVYGLGGLVPDTLAITRISKDGRGALVSIKTGNMIPSAAANSRDWILYWAKGGATCFTGIGSAPPAI